MSILDVALRLRLINQLSGGAKQATRDLTGIKSAASNLAGRGAEKLGRDVLSIASASRQADRSLRDVKREAAALGAVRGPERLKSELVGVSAAATKAERAMAAVRNAVRNVRARDAALTSPPETSSRRAGPVVVGGSMRNLAGGVGAFMLGRSAIRGFTGAAADDRRFTRIGITADAGAPELARAAGTVRKLARDLALPVGALISGLDTLTAQGRDLKDAMALLPRVGASAQASGADVEDIARSADAIGTHLKIGADKMQEALDIAVTGGKLGQFELKDQARYLPSMAPAAAAVGMKGQKGLADLVAMLQIMRKGSGTAEEAASSMQNILQKMESDETLKLYKKQGVDLEEAFKKGRREGRNLIEVFEDATWKAVGGDLSRITKIIHDMEFARGVRALLSMRGEWQKMSEEMRRSSAGATVRDLAKVTGDTQASVDRLSDSWSQFWQGAGRLADSAGLSKLLSGLASGANQAADSLNQLSTPEGRVSHAEDFARKQQQGLLGQQVHELSEKIRLREESLRAAGELPKSKFPGRFQSAAQDQARRRAEALDDPDLQRWRLQRAERELRIQALERRPELDLRPSSLPPPAASALPHKPKRLPVDLPPSQILEDIVPKTAEGKVRASMDAVNKALAEGGKQAVAESKSITDQVKSLFGSLNFTVTPTISPRFGGGPAGGPGSVMPQPQSAPSPAPASGMRQARAGALVTGNTINFHGIRDLAAAHRELTRLADRDVAEARDGALHDTWTYS